MRLEMNGPLATIASVSVIMLATMIPTPNDQPVITTLNESEAHTEQLTRVSELAMLTEEVEIEPAFENAIILAGDFPGHCVPERRSGDPLSFVECTDELATFIADRKGMSYDQLLTRGIPRTTDAQIEEARRALAEICRAEWSSGKISDTSESPACQAIQ